MWGVIMGWSKNRPNRLGKPRWTAYYRDESEVTRSAGTYSTKREADRAWQEEESHLRSGRWIDPNAGKITLAAYALDHWFPSRLLETNTMVTYESLFRVHIAPSIGARTLESIRRSTIQAWVFERLEAGVSRGTVRSAFKLLKMMLAAKKGPSALGDEFIPRDVCHGIDLPVVPVREVTATTPDVVERLMAELDPWYVPLVLMMSASGIRWGEAVGVRVSDLDLNSGLLCVRQTIIEPGCKRSGNGTRFAVKPYPKGRRSRTFQLEAQVVESLAEVAAARNLQPHDLLFSSPTVPARDGSRRVSRTSIWTQGVPVSRNHFRTGIWMPATRAVGVGGLRPHDLRASNITWLLAGGADLANVMQRAGHRHMSTTQRYVTVLPDAGVEALAALARVRARFPATAKMPGPATEA